MKIATYQCRKCGEKWIPRTINPKLCPSCKCRKWNAKKLKGK